MGTRKDFPRKLRGLCDNLIKHVCADESVNDSTIEQLLWAIFQDVQACPESPGLR